MTGIFRSGQSKLIKSPVASASVIGRNDMVSMDASTDEIVAAGDFLWDTDLATTQATFADIFLGIARESSANLETDTVDVDVSADAVYEFTVASATYTIGQSLGPDKASGNALLDQTLEGAVAASAIARSVESKTAAVTVLRVTFASAHYLSGANVNAQVGGT